MMAAILITSVISGQTLKLPVWIFGEGKLTPSTLEFLDQAGGFFYERWGDAPVHSIAANLFLDKDEVHYFDDVGYWHNPLQIARPMKQFETRRSVPVCQMIISLGKDIVVLQDITRLRIWIDQKDGMNKLNRKILLGFFFYINLYKFINHIKQLICVYTLTTLQQYNDKQLRVSLAFFCQLGMLRKYNLVYRIC